MQTLTPLLLLTCVACGVIEVGKEQISDDAALNAPDMGFNAPDALQGGALGALQTDDAASDAALDDLNFVDDATPLDDVPLLADASPNPEGEREPPNASGEFAPELIDTISIAGTLSGKRRCALNDGLGATQAILTDQLEVYDTDHQRLWRAYGVANLVEICACEDLDEDGTLEIVARGVEGVFIFNADDGGVLWSTLDAHLGVPSDVIARPRVIYIRDQGNQGLMADLSAGFVDPPSIELPLSASRSGLLLSARRLVRPTATGVELLDLQGGRYEVDLGGPVQGGLRVIPDHGGLLIASMGDELVAMSTSDLEIRWVAPFEGHILGPVLERIILDDGHAYLATSFYDLANLSVGAWTDLVDTEQGERVWRQRLGLLQGVFEGGLLLNEGATFSSPGDLVWLIPGLFAQDRLRWSSPNTRLFHRANHEDFNTSRELYAGPLRFQDNLMAVNLEADRADLLLLDEGGEVARRSYETSPRSALVLGSQFSVSKDGALEALDGELNLLHNHQAHGAGALSFFETQAGLLVQTDEGVIGLLDLEEGRLVYSIPFATAPVLIMGSSVWVGDLRSGGLVQRDLYTGEVIEQVKGGLPTVLLPWGDDALLRLDLQGEGASCEDGHASAQWALSAYDLDGLQRWRWDEEVCGQGASLWATEEHIYLALASRLLQFSPDGALLQARDVEGGVGRVIAVAHGGVWCLSSRGVEVYDEANLTSDLRFFAGSSAPLDNRRTKVTHAEDWLWFTARVNGRTRVWRYNLLDFEQPPAIELEALDIWSVPGWGVLVADGQRVSFFSPSGRFLGEFEGRVTGAAGLDHALLLADDSGQIRVYR